MLATAEEEKKCKYRSAAEECHASFSLFVVTVDVVHWGIRLVSFCTVQQGSCLLVGGKTYSEVLGWIMQGTAVICCHQSYALVFERITGKLEIWYRH